MNNDEQDDTEIEQSLDINTPSTQEEQPEIMEKAKKYGYQTKDEWEQSGKDPSRYKSPEEFVRFGEDYGKNLKAELAQIKLQNAQLLEYNKRTTENAVKQAKVELERHLTAAKQQGDVNAVELIIQKKTEMELNNRQIEETNRTSLLQQKAREEADANARFVERNAHWYNEGNPELQKEAQNLAVQVFSEFPNISHQDAAQRVENRMKWNHPELETSNRPSPRISNSRSNVNKTAVTQSIDNNREFKKLSVDQQAEYKAVLTLSPNLAKHYTVADYLAAFKE